VLSVKIRLLVIVPFTVTVSAVALPKVVLPVAAKPLEVRVVPSNVKLAESVSRPLVEEYTTRLDVRLVLVTSPLGQLLLLQFPAQR